LYKCPCHEGIYREQRYNSRIFSQKKSTNPLILNLSTRSSSSLVNLMPWMLIPGEKPSIPINNRLREECMACTWAVLPYFIVNETNTCSSLYHYPANEPAKQPPK